MNMNIDIAIFIGFLLVTLVLGLTSSRGIRNIREYAVGNRDFSTATLSATLIATWIGGEDFFAHLAEAYNHGLYFIWAGALGYLVSFLCISYFFAPRLGAFLGKISIAEAMGDLFGEKVRVITAVAGFIGTSGIIAVQLNVAGSLFEYCFGVSKYYGIFFAGSIITLYSTLGGIKSVTFTDVIQLFTFSTIIPTIAFFLVNTLGSAENLANVLVTNESFDYSQVFDFTRPKSLYYLFLFFYIAIPAFNPAIFQRVAMAKNTTQIKNAFAVAGVTCFFLILIIYWISIIVLSTNPNLTPGEVGKHIIVDYSYVGLRGLTLAGIMAMVMSTADSYINSTSVLIVNDFFKPLKFNLIRNELAFSRIVSLVIGTFSILLAFRSGGLLELFIFTGSFYMPIVTVPFILAVFGFRGSSKSVLTGMIGGFVTVIIWEMILKIKVIDAIVPGMLANLIFLLIDHYFFNNPSGLDNKKSGSSKFVQSGGVGASKFTQLVRVAKFFDIVNLYQNNYPKKEGLISVLGLFTLVSSFSAVQTLSQQYQVQYRELLNLLYPAVLCGSSILLSYPLWLETWKNNSVTGVLWNLITFSILIWFSFFLVLASNFSEMQLMVFMVNIIVIMSLTKWQWSLFNIFLGVLVVTFLHRHYYNLGSLSESGAIISQFKISYLLLLVTSSLVIFLKPKQEYHDITELKADHLSERITAQEKQLQEALALRGEFIRNINHEYHAPMTGISSMAQTLKDSYFKLNDKQRIIAIDTILKSSARLEVFDANISSLAKLCRPNYELTIKSINLGNLVHERLAFCRKLYEENKETREFSTEIESEFVINGDKYYLTQLFDNLIINAITYCKQGRITLALRHNADSVEFTITDEGIGIPKEEIYDIFGEFTVSSKTKTFAGGRGVGLALAKKVVEIHGGTIKADSNGIKGANFTCTLPYLAYSSKS